MPIARVNDADIYYEIHGDGDWMILIHGGGTHLDWWRQTHRLRAHYKCLVYDVRGHGQSSGTVDYATGGPDLVALMDHLKIERAILNGHSAGGWAASAVAQSHPARVRALVMTASHFGFNTAALHTWAGNMLTKVRAGYVVWDHMFSPKFAARDPETHFVQASLGRLNAARAAAAARAAPINYEDAYAAMRETPVVDYSGFSVPAVFITGSDDNLTTPDVVKGTCSAVKGARYVEIPDAGHFVLAEQPEAYYTALIGFLEQVS